MSPYWYALRLIQAFEDRIVESVSAQPSLPLKLADLLTLAGSRFSACQASTGPSAAFIARSTRSNTVGVRTNRWHQEKLQVGLALIL